MNVFFLNVSLILLAFGFWSNVARASSDVTAYQLNLLEDAQNQDIGRLQFYEKGVYGKRNNTIYYFIHNSALESKDSFYFTMVRVLSEKFGCFMRGRSKGEGFYAFGCRDGRTVVLRHGQKGETLFFTAKQFSRNGKEIFINNVSH